MKQQVLVYRPNCCFLFKISIISASSSANTLYSGLNIRNFQKLRSYLFAAKFGSKESTRQAYDLFNKISLERARNNH